MKFGNIYFLILSLNFILTHSFNSNAQCRGCKSNSFKSSYNFPQDSPNDYYSGFKKYSDGNDLPSHTQNQIKLSLLEHYSARFSDSCRIIHVAFKNEEQEDAFAYRITFNLSLPNNIKYKFGLDFNLDGTESFFDFPRIPDTILFNQNIMCCKAGLSAEKDKAFPFTKIESINLRHYFSPLVGELNGFYWVVYGLRSKPNKHGIISQPVKLIDLSSFSIVRRDVIKLNGKKVIFDEEVKNND